MDVNREKALDLAVSQIERQFGKGAIMKLGEAKKIAVETIPTGSISLDIALGGGIPRGRVVEIFGPESSGKTTLTLHVMAEAQKRGGQAAFGKGDDSILETMDHQGWDFHLARQVAYIGGKRDGLHLGRQIRRGS